MRSRWLATSLVVLAALCRPATGEDAPKPKPAPEEAARLKRLKARAETWWNARKGLVKTCDRCGGVGRIRWGRQIRECPECDGRKRKVPADVYRKLYYDMRSPAFRLQDGIQARVEDEYKVANGGQWPMDVDRFKITEQSLVDATHGVVLVIENKDTVARPQRWVWADEKEDKGEWWLWDETADGPWPAQKAEAISLAPPEPLTDEEGRFTRECLDGVGLQHTIADMKKRGTTLVLSLEVGSVPGGTALGDVAIQDLRGSAKAVLKPAQRWEAVEWSLLAKWRDAYGQVEAKPYMTAVLTKAAFDKIRWENLEPHEQLALFAPKYPEYPGWKIWHQ
jgi:hypothetical protein